MEKWERPRPPPHCGGAGGQPEKPSFSSTLLDAIYRSIDGDETTCGSHHPSLPHSTTTTTARKQTAAFTDRRRPYASSTTSSSSDCSSYGSFSSSDTEPSIRYPGLRPVRTAPPPPLPERKNQSIGSRLRELRRAKTPASPGARLASFLNSLFTAKKPRSGTEARLPAARPCLSKASSLRERPPRSVRFDPVSVVVPSGRRCGVPAAPPPGKEVKERLSEVLRRFEEDDGGETDSSSDLFELENLKGGLGRGGGGQYRDELPVFETTHIRVHRAPSLRF